MCFCRKLYWTNWNKDSPSIQRANLDGEKLETIISTDIKTPNAIALDHKGQYLFWADALLDKIERARFDGSERKVCVSEDNQISFFLKLFFEFIWLNVLLLLLIVILVYKRYDVIVDLAVG